MKNILPHLTAVICLAVGLCVVAAPSRAADETAADTRITAGDQLLLQAMARLERRESVAARLRLQANHQGQQLFGAGSYWQQGSGDQLRVRLEMQATGGETSWLEVTNGRQLWVDYQLPTERRVTQLDLRRLRVEVARAAARRDDPVAEQANWSPIGLELAAQYSGLPRLLAALSASFSFDQPQAMRFTLTPSGASEATNVPVFALVGHWKRERLGALLPGLFSAADDDRSRPRSAELPPRLPEEVLVLIGQDDLFPYRIEYRRRLPNPHQLSGEPLALLELTDVSFDLPIGASQFDYVPPSDAKWDDITAECLDQIRETRNAERAAPNRR